MMYEEAWASQVCMVLNHERLSYHMKSFFRPNSTRKSRASDLPGHAVWLYAFTAYGMVHCEYQNTLRMAAIET